MICISDLPCTRLSVIFRVFLSDIGKHYIICVKRSMILNVYNMQYLYKKHVTLQLDNEQINFKEHNI